jgi:hypothetical protein
MTRPISHPARTATVLCVVLFGVAPQASAVGPLDCPSFPVLGRRLDAKVAEVIALKPGLPLTEFDGKYAFRALNFWDDVGSERETVFFVGVKEGNASVSDQVVCRFDQSDRLRSCRKECCRHATRTITKEQYDSLALGDSRTDVERRLCSPSDWEVDKKAPTNITTYYHIDLPIHHHDEGQTVMLVFKGGKLTSRDMSPYY